MRALKQDLETLHLEYHIMYTNNDVNNLIHCRMKLHNYYQFASYSPQLCFSSLIHQIKEQKSPFKSLYFFADTGDPCIDCQRLIVIVSQVDLCIKK